jgi:hypothetical protein
VMGAPVGEAAVPDLVWRSVADISLRYIHELADTNQIGIHRYRVSWLALHSCRLEVQANRV